MIIEKPSIFIYVNKPDANVLKQICAGIEEEGLFFEIREMEMESADMLAGNAADASMLGSGVGIAGTHIALKMRGLDKNIESYMQPAQAQCRKLGANSARAVKKLAFK